MSNQMPSTTGNLPEAPQIVMHVDALGLLCFNPDKNRAEFGFLLVNDHTLEIAITEKGTTNHLIPCGTKITVAENLIGSGGSIEIFEKEGDNQSLSFIPDLDDIYKPGFEFTEGAHFPCKLFIENAVISSDPDSQVQATPVGIAGPMMTKPPRQINRAVVISTKSPDGVIRINNKDIALERGKQYEGTITNGNCPHKPLDGDFKFYFNLLKNAGDTQFNMIYEDDPQPVISPGQRTELNALLESLNSFFTTEIAGGPDGKDKMRVDILRRLDCLKTILCKPAPCDPGKVGGRSLPLPG